MQVSKLHANCATETTSETYLPQVSVTTALQKGAMGRKPRVKNESSFFLCTNLPTIQHWILLKTLKTEAPSS